MKLSKLCVVVMLAGALSLASTAVWAQTSDSEPSELEHGYWTALLGLDCVGTSPAFWGGEATVSGAFQPIDQKNFWIAPKVDFLLGHGNLGTRWNFGLGLESLLWLGNALAPWIGVDVLPFGHEGEGAWRPDVRFENGIAVRLSRFQKEGAWNGRIGVGYSLKHQWQVRIGITLQFSGVP